MGEHDEEDRPDMVGGVEVAPASGEPRNKRGNRAKSWKSKVSMSMSTLPLVDSSRGTLKMVARGGSSSLRWSSGSNNGGRRPGKRRFPAEERLKLDGSRSRGELGW